jgi:ribosome-binding protein aMBF1 (putative translation factor)
MMSASTIFVDLDADYLARYGTVMLTAEQSRAARGWLGWSQSDLASRASVSLSAVRDFEKGRHTPIRNNLAAMLRALEHAGMRMEFDADGKALGVRRTRET